MLKAIDPSKPILGYVLKQRLGSGGYGEVWAAEAPGGLPKAVKFVYGYHEEKRAQAELKALNRIRSVRHPFLLSLERIDVVDGQLVVITELADMCLKTRFDECVESGLKGIPRAELISYMQEAAGALDFIADEFKLQHLDVKPENLLLVSGHVKVADFGLVKDIHDGSQSMMSGLTPAYAPPELFDGRPNRASDQYSLAILFQELLTGTRPFDGATAAQLATQHIRERPNLKPLPREDQAIIGRALSKQPDLRYSSCSAMVDALSAERTRPAAPRPRQRTKLREGRRRRSRRSGSESTMSLMSGTHQFDLCPREIVKLPKLEYDAKAANCRPTFCLGLGNTGTRVLTRIRQKLWERHGHPSTLPAIKLLAVDTDPRDLTDACLPSNGLTPEETFAMPLREPKAYRDDPKMHLGWLNRRWIYNVPKSLRTEGIRTLGRLALATHIDELSIRIRQVMSDLVLPEHLATTAETLELDPNATPRVIIVGAASGGTCSGSAIDFAYLIRAILYELSVPAEDVLGFFTHSTTSEDSGRELSIANTLAFLSELHHFSCVEEYPGDESLDIPAFTDRTTTFASTYLMPLGEDLSEEKLSQQIDGLAEYLCLASASRCGTYFDNCRTAENESQGMPLRTIGIAHTNASQDSMASKVAGRLGRELIRSWGSQSVHEGFDPEQVAVQLLKNEEATLEPLVRSIHGKLNEVFGDAVEQIRLGLKQRFQPGDRAASKNDIWHYIEDVLAFGDTSNSDSRFPQAVEGLLTEFRTQRVPRLADAVLAVVDLPNGPRISGADRVASVLTRSLVSRQNQLEEHARTISRRIQQRYEILLAPDSLLDGNVDTFFVEWAKVILQRFTIESSLQVTKTLIEGVVATSHTIQNLRTQLTRLVMSDVDAPSGNWNESKATTLEAELGVRIEKQLEANSLRSKRRLNLLIQQGILQPNGGLRAVLGDAKSTERYRMQFQEALGAIAIEQLKSISFDDLFDDVLSVEQCASWLVEGAQAKLTSLGGELRAMYAHPVRGSVAEGLLNEVRGMMDCQPAVIPATVGEIVACMEAERVPLENVAMDLLRNRPDAIEYASRLHTRTDVNWTHISSMR